jgi:hypothetical protein
MNSNANDHLFEILLALNRLKVKFVVCGGVAAVLHGVERMTVDLDIAIDFKPENVKKFIVAMKQLGLTPRAPVRPEVLLDKNMRDNLMKEKHAFVYTLLDINNPFRQVDVFLSDENSYATLIAKSELLKIGGQRIRVVSVKDLISMKQKVRPRREKDGFDIKMLKKLLQ